MGADKSTPPAVFLVIPCYREEKRLAAFLPELLDGIRDFPARVVVQVVDDGSGDVSSAELAALVRRLSESHPETLRDPLLLPGNLGKGGAVFAGWDLAMHEDGAEEATWLAFADADGATSATEILRLAQIALDSQDLDGVLGSRILMMGKTVTRSQKRHIVGRAYATLTTLFTGIEVYDSQCGCKFVRNRAYQKIRPRLEEKRFGFDMELIAFLLRSGAKLEEFPVDWTDVPGSRVRLFRDGWRMFASLWKLRKRLRTDSGTKVPE